MAKAEKNYKCITLIGMAGCGKSTVANQLAQDLGWTQLDSDHLIEAIYARPLQQITDALSREQFLELEADTICSLDVKRVVISTGGSVPYRKRAIEHLQSLGPVIWLDAPLELIEERIALNPARGLVIAPGQTIGDLLNERIPYYRQSATHVCQCGAKTPLEISEWIREKILAR